MGFSDWATVWNPVKLVVAPILDGLGTGSWNSMLRRTDIILRRDNKDNGKILGEDTAVSRFFHELATLGGQGSSDHIKKQKIEIIGHSMGTIITNNIIAKHQSEIEFTYIVYMAAACRVKDIQRVIVPYLMNNHQAQFYSLSLHPKQDILENYAFDFTPRGSLLIWIDETFGDINSFDDKTAGLWFNVTKYADLTYKNIPGNDPRVHLTRFGIGSGPQKHGSFDEYDFWNKRFWVGDHKKLFTNN